MKCSDFAKRIEAHIAQYGDGEIYLSRDRRAPEVRAEGADALAIDQRVVPGYIVEDDDD